MSKSDMFLSVVGKKSGAIKGESEDDKHKGEIDVLSWSWGISGRHEMSGLGAAGKARVKELKVVKQVDVASPALMNVAMNNEEIKKAVLAVRKAGTTQQEYCKFTIENGRITGIDVQTTGHEMLETVSFAYQKIEVECKAQGKDGQTLGSATFNTDILES